MLRESWMSRCLIALGLALPLALGACKTKEPKPDEDPTEEKKKNAVGSVDEGLSSTTPDRERLEPLPVCGEEDENCRVEKLGAVRVGWIDENTTPQSAVAKLGEPATKGERMTYEASGDIVEEWSWPDAGVKINVTAPDMEAEPDGVLDFTVMAPFSGKTDRGVGIGDPQQAVLDAYEGIIAPESRVDEMLIAGSLYGGVFFRIKDERVLDIFVGAGAE